MQQVGRPRKRPVSGHFLLALALLAAQALFVSCTPPNPERDKGILKAHPNWRERTNAAERLGWTQSPEVVPYLIEALQSDEDLFVRNAAAQALGELKDPRAVEPLIKTLLHDIAVREAAGKALASIDGPIVEARLKSLARDKDPIAREDALEALAFLNTDGHLSGFFEETMKDSSPSVRRKAVESLRVSTQTDGKRVDPLVNFIRSRETLIRAHSAEDMGLAQESAYVPFLIETASTDPDEEVRRAACVALGRIGTDEATDALIRFLDDPRVPDDGVLRGLAYTRKRRAVEPIIEAYAREGFPKEEAISALAEIGGPKVAGFFKDQLVTERGSLRRSIIDALESMKGKEAAKALIDSFGTDQFTQLRVVRALEKLGGDDVTRFLAQTTLDSETSPAAKRAALEALKSRGTKASAEYLREAALSRRPEVSRAAKEAMEALGISPVLKPPGFEEPAPEPFRPSPPGE